MKCLNCGAEILDSPRILCANCFRRRKKPSKILYVEDGIEVVANNTGKHHKFDREDAERLEGLAWYETPQRILKTRINQRLTLNADCVVGGVYGVKRYRHIDKDPYNHRKSNLEPVGSAEPKPEMFCKYRGVYRLNGGYVASLRGTEYSEPYATPEEAARRYDREQLILHGPVAITNVNTGLLPENETYKYTEKFRLVADEVLRLARGPKTEAYGETWKNTGLLGIYVKIMIKEGRLHQLVWKDRNFDGTGGESVRDTLLDIAAYAMYGVIAFDEKNWEGSTESRIKLLLQEVGDQL